MSCVALEQSYHPDRPQRVVVVEFESNDGSRWRALGGGHTLAEAIAYARDSTPPEFGRVTRIGDLYGE
jgi:hypothetical protein